MKLLFIADGRSPTAAGWMEYFLLDDRYEVHLVSTFPATPLPGLASYEEIPAAFARLAGSTGGSGNWLRRWTAPGSRAVVLRRVRAWTLGRRSAALQRRIVGVEPDLVHALRIPFEGLLAAAAYSAAAKLAIRMPPLVLSVWGNDLTLHAAADPTIAALTAQALTTTHALLADCRRDIRLAYEIGLPRPTPTAVIPGGGGVRPKIFFPGDPDGVDPRRIVQPRGLRAYVENETFLHAVPAVLDHAPDVRFDCPGLAGDPRLAALAGKLGIEHAIRLLPALPQTELAALFRRAAVILSPTTHDGTPNSLLEALACGCFPIAGDLESIREWITPGLNGLLVDPRSPVSIASAILECLGDPVIRSRARLHNLKMISERALYGNVMPRAGAFYENLV
ncbi:MAG TPA: glycosyltransferase family 4 protein [Anaerolineales bacterium]|nr:glycosyltransferase family 4 protein [Anaerolineales bacterium]